MINTILVEDDLYIQKHFAERLKSNRDFRLVGVYRDAFEAERNCSGSIHLILMDVQTQHKHSGLAAAQRIKKAFPNIKIVVVTSLVDPEVLSKAKNGAADSLWYKDTDEETMVDVIRRTMQGEHIFPDAPPPVNVGTAKSTEFTKTELRILRYIVKGMSYAKIAEELGVEVTTVKYHVTNMLQKTNFKNKLQLALAVTDVKLIAELADDE